MRRCAEELARCRFRGAIVSPRRLASVPVTEQQAYDTQRLLHTSLASTGRSVVGHKIGCTSHVMQAYLGVEHPCAGGIYGDALWLHLESTEGQPPPHVRASRFSRVGFECELAVKLSKRLGPGLVTLEEAADAVGSIHVAIELVDDRYEDFANRQPDWPVWLADDFFHAGQVIGPPLSAGDLTPPELAMRLHALQGEMHVKNQLIGAGAGSDILSGHPLEALTWLADSKAAPEGLPADWLVSLGSVTKTHWEPREAREPVTVRASFSCPAVPGLENASAVVHVCSEDEPESPPFDKW